MARQKDAIADAVIGVFARRRPAEACIRSLHEAGFAPEQIGFIGLGVLSAAPAEGVDEVTSAAAMGSANDGVVGGVLGAIVTGPLPEVGAVVAGGLLAGAVAAKPAEKAGGAIKAALREVGMAPALALAYERQVHAGQFLVTVHGDRLEEAAGLVAARGGQVEGPASRGVSQVTGTIPAALDTVEGLFDTRAVAEAFAAQLRAAFPDRVVVVEEAPPPMTVVGSEAGPRPRARVIVSR